MTLEDGTYGRPGGGFGEHGSALVLLDDERASLATVLVLQEMGFSVDVASGREAAIEWAGRASYAVAVCGGSELPEIAQFLIELRYSAPKTRVILLAGPTLIRDGLEELGVEVLPSPVDVNMLVDMLRPAAA